MIFRKQDALSSRVNRCKFDKTELLYQPQEKKWRPPSNENIGVAKEGDLIDFKRSPFRDFQSDSRKQGNHV